MGSEAGKSWYLMSRIVREGDANRKAFMENWRR